MQRRFAIAMVDYYSKWPEVAFCAHPNSESVIEFLETVASRGGYPEELVCDNGTALLHSDPTSGLSPARLREVERDVGGWLTGARRPRTAVSGGTGARQRTPHGRPPTATPDSDPRRAVPDGRRR